MRKELHNCTSVDDICEQLANGKYVFTYVELKNKTGVKFISAYHLCDYGLESFSFDRKSNEFPLKLRRADVRYPDHIDNLSEMVKEHMTKRFAEFSGFVVCDAMLELDNIPKPTRFKAFSKKIA